MKAVYWLTHEKLLPWYLPIVGLVWWQIAIESAWIDPQQWVSPMAVVKTFFISIQAPEFWTGIALSLGRFFSGLFIGGVLGILFGIGLARSNVFSVLLGPSFNLLRQISLFAWIPLLSVYLGYTDLSKITFIALACFYPIALNTYEGVNSIPKRFFEAARVYELTGKSYWLRFIFPAASQRIYTGIQLGVIYAWLGTVGAEFLLRSFGSYGISDTLINGRTAYVVDQIILGTVLIGVMGFALNRVVESVEKHQLRWLPTQS